MLYAILHHVITTSSRVTGPFFGEFTGQRWISHTKASDVEFWCFLWSVPWIKGWVNNLEADDLRCHHAHYDVIAMLDHTLLYWDLTVLTHWGRVLHKCISKVAIIGSDNGLSPGRRQAIIWTNAGILSTGLLGTSFKENAFENVVCKIVAILSWPQCVKYSYKVSSCLLV